jgi:VWFA-related protein
MSMMRHVKLAALVVFLAGTVLGAGQAPQPPLPQTPTFKVQVDYVDVDVLVTDKEGRFVRDLTKEDFEVFEDGRRQTIANFSVVDIPIERLDRPLYSPEPLEPDVESNEDPFEGRLYVLILDDVHIDATRTTNVKMGARQFIERYLGANDVMAVIQTGGRTDVAQEFTNNRRLLLSSVDKFIGKKIESTTLARNTEYFRQAGMPNQGRIADPHEQERAFNARQTLSMLQSVAEWFSGVRGRRKTILFVSEGIDYDLTDVIRQYDATASAASGIIDDIRQTIAATARSNVSIYGIDPRGLTTLNEETIGVSALADQSDPSLGIGNASLRRELMMSQDSLRALSDETGGFAVVNTNQFATAFNRIVTDNSTYYVLAYYPPADKKDGKFHRIEVRTKRPGLTVRARRGYIIPKPKAPSKPPANGPSPALAEALQSPLNVSGLGLRIFAAPFKGAAPNASVLLGVEIVGSDLSLTQNGRVELSYLAVDAKGKTFGAKTDAVTLNLRPETKERVASSGLRMLNRLDLPPGRYQLRVASHDVGGGTVGSVLYDLEIPDYAKLPFSMSGLLITSLSGASMVTPKGDEQTQKLLPAPPIAQRTFPENDEIALFTEIYDDGTAPPHKVDIVTSIRSDEGRVFFKNEEERDSKELEGKRGGYGYTARVPLTGLTPGPYVLTVEARSRQGNNPAASRQVRIDILPEYPGRR